MAQHSVVILYKCALLGEGIAKYLRAQIGVDATLASANDPQAIRSALSFGPEVVVFEMSDTLRQFDLAALAPHADLIDVSTVMNRGPVVSSNATGLERILQAVRRSSAVGCSNTFTKPAEPCPRAPRASLAAPPR
jgi:hypothetical protein